MPANHYRFVEQWTIPGHRPDAVYEVLYNATLLPIWWSGVYLEVVPFRSYGRPVVGAKARVKARGFLPYTLSFELEALTLDPGRRVEVRATGDFEGIWRAELFEDGDGTRVEIHWEVQASQRSGSSPTRMRARVVVHTGTARRRARRSPNASTWW